MLKIPYGESNFETVITQNYFYQDRTNYIRELEEDASKFLFFLRPRRFGKSLFITMLHYYYGLEYQNKFEKLFGQLAIGKKPTPLANQYMILSFEFSRINTKSEESTFNGFLDNIKMSVQSFLEQYIIFFPSNVHKEILEKTQPEDVLKALFQTYFTINLKQELPKIYILIDEYDHFANELISFNYKYFATSVSQNGFVRKFYETIKTATRDGIVERLFVTGVSPITLDSLTSGFNIGLNISLLKDFHNMMGFTENEVSEILVKVGTKENDLQSTMQDLKAWYDGYLFNINGQHIYNPDMVLYFIYHYQKELQYPEDLLDPNIVSDYSKIKNIFKIQSKGNDNIEVLKQLNELGHIDALITRQFSLEKDFSLDDAVSLLFYMGFLTIQRQNLGIHHFVFPNFVIKRLYANYFVDMVKEKAALPIENRALHFALADLAKYGNPKPFYAEVEKILTELSNRDLQQFSENSLKAIFISLLFQQKFYLVHSEYETSRKYVDIFLESIKNYDVPFEIAFELKYAKMNEKVDIDEKLVEAETQLLNYLDTNKFNQRPNVKAFVVFVQGAKIYSREIEIK